MAFTRKVKTDQTPNDKKAENPNLITLTSMIKNPGGPNSAYFANRSLIIDAMNIKFAQLTRKYGMWKTFIYANSDRTNVVYLVKVPSESEKRSKVTYDVVFDIDLANTKNIFKAPMKMYSNSPSFVFTYAHVMYNMDMIPKWLYLKMNKKSRENAPNVKNQYQTLGFEKSLYYAIKYLQMMEYGALHKHSRGIQRMSHANIMTKISTYDVKLGETRKDKATKKDIKKTKGMISKHSNKFGKKR